MATPNLTIDPGNPGPPTDQSNQRAVFVLLDKTGAGDAQPLILPVNINPEEVVQQFPSRISTVMTISGAYQDNWGPGVGKIQLAGTTGWNKRNANGYDGYQMYNAIKNMHEQYQKICAENDPSQALFYIIVPPGLLTGGVGNLLGGIIKNGAINLQPQFAIVQVSSDNFQAQRTKSQPLLFRYQWEFTILKDMLQAQPVDPSKQFRMNVTSGPGDPTSGPPPVDPGTNDPGSGTDDSGPPPDNPNDPPVQGALRLNTYPTQSILRELPDFMVGTGSGAVTLAKLAANYAASGMTVNDIRAFNNGGSRLVRNLDANAPVPNGVKVFIPGPVWLTWKHQSLVSTQAA